MSDKLRSTLYVAATPLGNLEDATPRLRHILSVTDIIYAEDTRRSRVLLEHLGLKKPLKSLHAHNEHERQNDVINYLHDGHDVVLLTDAGTPVVSDPGADAVDSAHRHGYRVSPIVGPSALTAALSVAGFGGTGGPVVFAGFWPRSGKARQQVLEALVAHQGTHVMFESPNRLQQTLADISAVAPKRLVCVCREMTKVYEECVRGEAAAMSTWAQSATMRGEMTVVIGPPDAQAAEAVSADDAALAQALKRCLAHGLSARDAAQAVSAIFDVARKRVYSLCLSLQP